MFNMFTEKYPDTKVSKEYYRKVFVNDFNIHFGLPRSDTCSKCDSLKVQIDGLSKLIMSLENDKTAQVKSQLATLQAQDKLHKMKAQQWYDRKSKSKSIARRSEKFEAITIDFCKNLPTPNIATNEIYY